MQIIKLAWVGAIMVLFTACGPETIFVRPNLDTADRHTANGQALLEQCKYQHALREFKRANELDPRHLDALIGLAVTLGHFNDMPQGLAVMEEAEKLAASANDQAKVEAGYSQLREIGATLSPR